MGGKVIQGVFLGARFNGFGPGSRPTVMARRPGSLVPTSAGRSQIVQARKPGPPLPAFAPHPPVAQASAPGNSFQVDPAQLGLASGGGRPLPDAVRGKMEAALGADFASVRVHVGPQAERIGAVAFTMGSDIYFAPGRFQPDTVQGQQLLGHELAHVVQQRVGRVRNPIGAGIAVVQDQVLEAEADRLGYRAAALVQKASSVAPRNHDWQHHGAARPIQNGPAKYPHMQRKLAIQRKPILNAQITGRTHLREASKEFPSLVRGTDFAEVEFPETVAIDMGDIWDSHLGINLSQTTSPTNVWYRVVSYGGYPITNREVYIRAEMIRPIGRLPVGASMIDTAQKSLVRAQTKGGTYNRQKAYQPLGDVWEEYLYPLMKIRRAGATLYWGLRCGPAELDFVFISKNSIRIVSAKISQTQFSPGTDRQHWEAIRQHWDEAVAATKVKREGDPISAGEIPDVQPIVTCESLATQGLSHNEFEAMIGFTGAVKWADEAKSGPRKLRARLAGLTTYGPGPDAESKKGVFESVLNHEKNLGMPLEGLIHNIWSRKYTTEKLGRNLVRKWTYQNLSQGGKTLGDLPNFQSAVGEIFVREQLMRIYPTLTTQPDLTPWTDVTKATSRNPDYQVLGTKIYIDCVLLKTAKNAQQAVTQAIKEDVTKRGDYTVKYTKDTDLTYWTAAFCVVPLDFNEVTISAQKAPRQTGTLIHLLFLDTADVCRCVDIK
jgi:hypothetical protein